MNAQEPARIADYVAVRRRLEVGERVSLPAGFHVLKVEVDQGVGDLTMWTLEPVTTRHHLDAMRAEDERLGLAFEKSSGESDG